MNTKRGILEDMTAPEQQQQVSPFSTIQAAGPDTTAKPFSPFIAVADEPTQESGISSKGSPPDEGLGRGIKLPERRKLTSPFQIAESTEEFGFEPPTFAVSGTLDSPPASNNASRMPSTIEAQAAPLNTLSQRPDGGPTPPFHRQSAIGHPAASALPVAGSPTLECGKPASAASTAAITGMNPFQMSGAEFTSGSHMIRQLELRAIFGVDRELTSEEILQRARSLSGVRHVAQLGPAEAGTIDELKLLLSNLRFDTGLWKLSSGSMTIEFIREGQVTLAVQTEGPFPPGVRETLMIIARELGRM